MSKISVTHVIRKASQTAFALNQLYVYQVRSDSFENISVVVLGLFNKEKRDNIKINGVDVHYTEMGFWSFCKYKKNAKSIFHFHNPVNFILEWVSSIFLCRSNNVVFTQHNSWLNYRFYHKVGLFLASRYSDKYVLCSDSIQSSLPKIMLKNKNLSVVNNGLDAGACVNNRSDAARRDIDVIIISRLSKQKNIFFLLDVVRRLENRRSVVWYGDGPLRGEFLKYIKDYNLKHLVFKGISDREEVIDALQKSKCYLSASLWEGLSLADLESIACGAYPILSNIEQRVGLSRDFSFDLLGLDNIDEWVEKVEMSIRSKSMLDLTVVDDVLSRKYSSDACNLKYYKVYTSMG